MRLSVYSFVVLLWADLSFRRAQVIHTHDLKVVLQEMVKHFLSDHSDSTEALRILLA